MTGSFRQPGDHILLRDVYRGHVRSAVPVAVVDHNEERLVTYLCEGTRFVLPADWNRKLERDFFAHPGNIETVWTGMGQLVGQVMIMGTGEAHGVMVRLSVPGRPFGGWYVNLQSPFRESPLGVDISDHMLDVLISPDRLAHQWKDEDELARAVAVGAVAISEAEAIRVEGERVIGRAKAGLPPFNEAWPEWRPDPSWAVPNLPEGWDQV